MNKLKLFVVGELSADPADWSGSAEHALVIAHNEKEAEMLAREAQGPAIEIPFDKPAVLIFAPGVPEYVD